MKIFRRTTILNYITKLITAHQTFPSKSSANCQNLTIFAFVNIQG